MTRNTNLGFSLIETMIVLAIFSIVMIAISQLLASNQRLLKSTESYIEQTSEHQIAFNQIKSQNQIAEIVGISTRLNAKSWFQSYISQRSLNVDNFRICLQGNTTNLNIDCSVFNFTQPSPNDPNYPLYPVTIHRIPADTTQPAIYESKVALSFECSSSKCSSFSGSLETSGSNVNISKSITKFNFPGKHAQATKRFLFSQQSGSGGVSSFDCGSIKAINLEDKTYICANKNLNLESGQITGSEWENEPYNLTESSLFVDKTVRASNYPNTVKAHGFSSVNIINKYYNSEYHSGVCISNSNQWNSYRSSDYDRTVYACCRSPLTFAPNDNPSIYNASPMTTASACEY